METKLSPYAKTFVAFLLAGLTALGTAMTDGKVTQNEWVAVAISALSTTSAVHTVPNSAKPEKKADEPAPADPPKTA